jgi:hypothetical protein
MSSIVMARLLPNGPAVFIFWWSVARSRVLLAAQAIQPLTKAMETRLHLTPDQVTAAEASGCTFVAAAEEQVQRLTMQRRVFWIDDRPVLVRRGSAPFETQGTLLALIADHLAAAPKRGADLPTSSSESAPWQDEPQPSPPSTSPDVVQAKPRTPGGPPARGRRRRKAVPNSEPPLSAATEAMTDDVPGTVEDEMLADVAAVQDSGRGARVISRHRAGQRHPPRWMAAGKARRDRLK